MSGSDERAPENKGNPAANNGESKKITWGAWLWESLSNPHNLPHHLSALFTFILAVFAVCAWIQARSGTAALEGQLEIMKAGDRPILFGTPAGLPTLNEAGQVIWGVSVINMGNGSAYNIYVASFIRVGNEKFQRGRTLGVDAIEIASPGRMKVMPPKIAGTYTTVASRPGITKEYFDQLMQADFGIGILLEFSYSDASGKTVYSEKLCLSHLRAGGIPFVPAEECRK